VPDIFDELNEDLRAERARAMAKRYGLLGGIVLLLIVAGVGGWQGWMWHQRQLAAAAAAPFMDAMRMADALWDAGDTKAAFGLWEAVSADDAADPQLRELASLLWAQHAVDKGDPAAITARTSKLEATGNPWRPLAEEVDALVALRQNDKDKAGRLLRMVLGDPGAAEGLRGRANGLLTLLGIPAEARG
jgi:hypothetical protein